MIIVIVSAGHTTNANKIRNRERLTEKIEKQYDRNPVKNPDKYHQNEAQKFLNGFRIPSTASNDSFRYCENFPTCLTSLFLKNQI